MSKLGKKLTISLSLAVLSIFVISILLTKYLLPTYSLYQTKKHIEQVTTDIQELDESSFLASIDIKEARDAVTIVCEPMIHTNLDDLNGNIRYQLAQKGVTLNKFWITEETLARIENGEKVNKLYNQEKLKSSFFASFIKRDDRLVLIGTSMTHVSETANIITTFYLYIAIFSLILIVIMVWFLSQRITIPLQKLKQALNRTSELNFETIDIRTNDEIEVLAHSFNTMNTKLQHTHQDLQRKNMHLKTMMSDLTHELKTPLALIKAYCVGMKDGLDDGTYVDTVIKHTDQLSHFIEEMLHFSKMERDELHKEIFDIIRLFDDCLEKQQLLLQQKNITVQVSKPDKTALFLADKNKIKMVFMNLLTNAIHYTTNHKIEVSFTEYDEMVLFEIKNGIDPSPTTPIERIWEPFFVLESSRNKDTSGTGLGLAIVDTVLDRHHFTHHVTITGSEIKFSIHFPKNRIK